MKKPPIILLNDKDHLKERARDSKPAEKAEKREREKSNYRRRGEATGT